MKTIVVKFGGSSLSSVQHFRNAAQKVATLNKESKIIVVVSAIFGETNKLIELTKQFTAQNKKDYDTVISSGEQVSSALMSLALQELDISTKTLQAWEIPITTSNQRANALIEHINTDKIKHHLQKSIVIIPGFQGVNKDNEITTLGRGGSDVTAVAIAAAIRADFCYLYKDVDGILSADPQIIQSPTTLENIKIEEMFELSSLGAKVIHPRAIEAALINNTDIKVLPTFSQTKGTKILHGSPPIEQHKVTGIVCNDDEVKFSLHDVPSSPLLIAKIFTQLEKENIAIDMILQTESNVDNKHNIIFTTAQHNLQDTSQILSDLQQRVSFSRIQIEEKISKISIVGAGIRGHAYVARTVYNALSALGINTYGISTTELKMSILVSSDYAHDLVKSLYNEFNL